MREPLPPIQVMQQAAGDHVKEIAAELNVSLTTIYKALSDDGYDTLGRLLVWHKAIAKCNPVGAEMIFQYFQAEHIALRTADEPAKDWDAELASAMTEAQAMFAEGVIKGKGFEVKAAKTIRRIRELVVLCHRSQ